MSVISITTYEPNSPSANYGVWTQEEHDRFLEALHRYPQGPWKSITEFIGTRLVRQVQTHAQKYNEKVVRRLSGTQKDRKTWARLEHRVGDEVLSFCAKKPDAILTEDTSDLVSFSETQAGVENRDLEAFEDSDDALKEALAWSIQDNLVFLDGFSVSTSTSTTLPSLEESLDFLINHLLDV